MKRISRNIVLIVCIIQIMLVGFIVIYIIRTNKETGALNTIFNEGVEFQIQNKNWNGYSFENDTTKFLQISKREFAEINNHINSLSQQVDNTCKYTLDILEKDIDRLNTYMALGIGFLALFGIFAPFFMNLTFKSEIENDIKDTKDAIKEVQEMKTIIADYETIKEPISKTIKDFPSVKDNFTALKNEIDSKLPKVNLLILQYQISRLYNVSKLDLTRPKRDEYFADVFQKILNSFNECKNLISESDDQSKIIVGDFHNNLASNRLRYYLFEKDKQCLVNDFCDSLVSIYTKKDITFEIKISSAISKLDAIVSYLKNHKINGNN